MAVAFVREHTAASIKTAGTNNLGLTISTAVAAGNVLVARILFDNAATASKPVVSSIGVAAGETNTWTRLGATYSTSTSAGAFASGEMWAIRTTVAWPVASYTVTFDTSTVMKATLVGEFAGASATMRSTSGAAYSTTTTAASATTTGTTPVIGDLALGFIFGSNVAAAQAGDTDTTGGSWSAAVGVGSTGGNAATNNFGIAQYKILTAASHQTLNNSAAMTAGNGAVVAILQDRPVEAPITSFSASATTIEMGQTVTFTDTSTGDPATSWAWNFGAGASPATATTKGPHTVTFSTAGTSTVAFSATNTGGTVAATPKTITVNDILAVSQAAYRFYAGNAVEPGLLLADTYGEENTGSSTTLTGTVLGYGQSFIGNGSKLVRAAFHLFKEGTPPGTVAVSLYAHTGTFGASGSVGTGTPLATSSSIAATSVLGNNAVSQWNYFDFDGTCTLAAGTPYVIAVEVSTLGTTGADVAVKIDSSSPTHPGRGMYHNVSGTWLSDTDDAIFRVYTDGAILAAQNTPYTADLTAGDANLQLRARLQSTSTLAVPVTDDWQLQWEKNASGTWNDVVALTARADAMISTAGNNVSYTQVNNWAQSFTGNGGKLSTVGWRLGLSSGGTGSVVCDLYTHTGTYGSGTPGTLIATSSNTLSLATFLVGSPGRWETFIFDETVTLGLGTAYFVSVRPTTAVTGSPLIFSPGGNLHSGNRISRNAVGWGTPDASDLDFEVRTKIEPLPTTVIGYDSPNLTLATVTTNQLGAGTGSFVAGKVSEYGLVDDLGWSGSNYTEVLYPLTLKKADLTGGDTLRFRVLRNGATTYLTYSQTPTVTIGTGVPVVGTGRPKVWTGAAWVNKPGKYWNGTTWTEKPVKVWTGSTWKLAT